MKRTVYAVAAAVVAFGSGYTGARTVAMHQTSVVRVADLGAPCNTADGRSGYMVSSGRGEPYCQASDES